ncbi:MAG TPA: MarR family transcriptional regulator [Gemmatimonadaceae bacterium]|nr:MarR family transcriptional regulator [Gemmatimonadaceae bacterium]
MQTLRDEIKQTKPFTSLEQEAQLNIVRTGAVLLDDVEQLLRPYGITATQYNVLRILRGSEPGGLCRNELRDRMITRMPDMTRLLDRMEDAGLVVRSREDEDRRMVRSRISAAGLKLLSDLDDVVVLEHKRRFEQLDEAQIHTLIELLTLIRQKP